MFGDLDWFLNASRGFVSISCRGGFNGRPFVQWPTRPLGGWTWRPGPRGPGRLNFVLQLQRPDCNLNWILIYLNLKRVCWFGVLFFRNFNKEISYFLTDNFPLVFKLHEFVQLILRNTIKIIATKWQTLRLKCTKFDFGCSSAPDHAGGAYSAPQTP